MVEGDVETAVRAARSWMFTPATRREDFEAAARCGADAVILDLEDSVRPQDKAIARAFVVEHLSGAHGDGLVTSVRINPAATAVGLADLTALISAGNDPDVLVLPRTESAGALGVIENLLFEAGSRTMLVPLIETARGLRALPRLLASQTRVVGVLASTADIAADLGGAGDPEVAASVRASAVRAASAAEVVAIDSPFFGADPAELERQARGAAGSGCTAKAAVHSGQLAAINAAFAPTAEELRWAHDVLKRSAARLPDVEEADAARARRYLQRARPTAERAPEPAAI
ncbi:aldolase/citrate lyase family protein [Saccharopolyspora sp. MS10]|uniref:aldolase/citrate lyase family protein n=1 Tax=Saccharopolyspora sp. MS10 TaxID=3385973 RepID=UPI0039A1CD7B